MEKQQITRQLHRLAQEEIPDTMNLWPGIQSRLKRKAKPRPFSLAHALSVFVMTMLVAVGGYAAYQTNKAADPIAPSYGVDLNLIQTSDAVTASLDWAYADENIIAVQYSVIYNPDFVDEPVYVSGVLRLSNYWFPTYGASPVSEPLSDGNVKFTTISYFNPTELLSSGQESINVNLDVAVYNNMYLFSSDVDATVPPPDTFTATPVPYSEGQATAIFTETPASQFEATIPPPDMFTATPIPGAGSNSSSSDSNFMATPTPFGEFLPTVPPPDAMTIEPSLIPPVAFEPTVLPPLNHGSFSFNFTLPIHQSQTGQATTAEVESESRAMSIQNITVTPLQTSFELCYNYPDLLGTWYPSVVVDTGFAPDDAQRYSPIIETMRAEYGKVYEATAPRGYPDGSWQLGLGNGDANCAPLTSFAAISEDAHEMDIHVDYLYRDTDPTDLAVWNNDIDFFAARGFSLTYELRRQNFENLSENVLLYPIADIGSVMVTIQDYPDTMTLDEARTFIFNNMLKERFEGDWSFHIILDN